MQVKPFTNQKVFSCLGNKHIKQAFISLFNHLHMENNHRTTVRPCLSHTQFKEHHCKKKKQSRHKEQDEERLVSESVTLSQFRVKKHHKQKSKKGNMKAIRVVYEIITCNMCVLGVTKPL